MVKSICSNFVHLCTINGVGGVATVQADHRDDRSSLGLLRHRLSGTYPDPLRDPRNGTLNMNPILHGGNKGSIRGFLFFGSFRGSG